MSDCHGDVRALQRRASLMKWIGRLSCVVLVVALGVAGIKGYGVWRKENLARQTEQFVARGDFKSAVLVARRLLEIDPNNLRAARAMAEMTEKAGSAEAVPWRRKIAQLEPGNTDAQIQLI